MVKDGQQVGEVLSKAGQPHAEVFAMREAGNSAQGATAYVTLEPCAAFGRTPPCARKVWLKQVLQKWLWLVHNPDRLVAGKGVQILKDAGIEVEVGVCEAEAHQLNLGFLKAMATGQPYVRLKVASSLDGSYCDWHLVNQSGLQAQQHA